MLVKEIIVNDYVTKSNLPFCDYVINPYVGCTHGCKYCYASFMKRFTGHTEEWGSFVDVKFCEKPLSKKKLTGKAVFLSSVTDPYDALEKKYMVTRRILKELTEIDCRLYISTKSPLILRDLDLLKQCSDVIVDMSLNTLDETFRRDMDHAGSVQQRLDTLQTLHDAGIHTVLFVSPWFPEITDFKALIEATTAYVDEYWFENLNLRGDYKERILSYIAGRYPHYLPTYEEIYRHGNTLYWDVQEAEFTKYCNEKGIRYTNAFNHSKLVAEKKRTGKLVRRD